MIKLKWILNFAPLITSVLMIRQYLGYFDQASLFTESLSLVNIFSLVFIYAVLATLAVLIIFYMPSIVLYSIIPKASGVIYYTKLKLRIALLLFCLMILAALLIFIWGFFIEGTSFWINKIGSAILIGLFLLAVFVLRRWILHSNLISILKYQKTNVSSTIKTIKIGALYIILVGLMTFSYSVVMMLRWINPEYEIANLKNFLSLSGVTVILGLNAIIPGVIYISIRPSRDLLYLTKNVIIPIIFFLFVLALTLTSLSPQVINKTMTMAGISDWKTRDFIIDEKVMPSRHFKHEEWNTEIIIPEKNYSIRGLLVYSLNDVKLVCPESVREHYDKMLKFMPFNHEYDKKMSQQLLDAGAYCQPFPNGGITRLSK